MITKTTIKKQYEPLVDTTSYPFDISYFEERDINVHIVDAEGNTTYLVLNAPVEGFVIQAVNGDPRLGGTVTTTDSYGDGYSVTIFRSLEMTQESEFVRGEDLPPEVLNASFDRACAISQQIQGGTAPAEEGGGAGERALVCPVTDPEGIFYTLPAVEARKSKAVGFDELGNATVLDLTETGTVAVDVDKGLGIDSNIIYGKVDDSTLEFGSIGEFKVKQVDTAHIADDAVTSVKIAPMSTSTVLGNMTGLPTNPTTVYVFDQDDMLFDSATALATQRSIKAYVDTTNQIIQVVNVQTGVADYDASPLDILPDNTIPQNTEGLEVMTLSITPTSSTSNLKIDIVSHHASAGTQKVSALFKDTDANALACGFEESEVNYATELSYSHYMVAGTTSAITFKVRVGSNTGAVAFNAFSGGAAVYGGVIASSITITEIG